MKDRNRKKATKRQYAAPAVDRALDILEFMAKHPHSYGATELSRCLNIPINSVFRILKRLTEREYTAQDPLSDGYQLSTKMFSLGMSLYTRFELRQRARPHLEWLCRESEETCQLQVPHGDMVLVLDTVSPEIRCMPNAEYRITTSDLVGAASRRASARANSALSRGPRGSW